MDMGALAANVVGMIGHSSELSEMVRGDVSEGIFTRGDVVRGFRPGDLGEDIGLLSAGVMTSLDLRMDDVLFFGFGEASASEVRGIAASREPSESTESVRIRRDDRLTLTSFSFLEVACASSSSIEALGTTNRVSNAQKLELSLARRNVQFRMLL